MTYWKDHPPTHVLVAAYLLGGSKPGPGKHRQNYPKRSKGKPDGHNFHDLTREVALAGGSLSNKLPEIYRNQNIKNSTC
jgi:hypothetical protein